MWTSPVDDAPLPPYRLAVLATAAARHRAWLADGSGLAARSQATYLQQAARYLAWLDGRPGLAAALAAPAAAGGTPAGEAARQAVADRAAARYHSHLASSGAAAASLKLALAAIGSLYRAAGLLSCLSRSARLAPRLSSQESNWLRQLPGCRRLG
jgi:hypothetical protein